MRREISTELKELRLHGMAQAWDELTTHEGIFRLEHHKAVPLK